MPTQWLFDLALSDDLDQTRRYDVLHAVACAFFEQDVDDHDAERKPFTARLGPWFPTGTQLTLSWLLDAPAPATVIPATVRLGRQHGEVTGFRIRKVAIDGHGGDVDGTRVRMRAHSPVKFRHHGRDYPLPDPYLTYRGLACRLGELYPGDVDEEAARELARSVVVYRHNIRTQEFTWHGSRSAGFIGTVTFGVPRTCAVEVRRLFAILNRFADFAGVGHGTTHGLGAVDVAVAPVPPAIGGASQPSAFGLE